MKLLELIRNLKSIKQANELIAKELPGVEYDLIDLYAINSLNVDSDIRFFNVEEIPNDLVIKVDGINYVNLFPLNLIQEMVEEYSNLREIFSDEEIAKRILEYRLKDA